MRHIGRRHGGANSTRRLDESAAIDRCGAIAPARLVSMRVLRYFAFVDLCGFTRFTEVHGDQEAVAVLTGFRSLVRDIASEHGVRVAKWLGDGAMFVSTDGPALAAALIALDRR